MIQFENVVKTYRAKGCDIQALDSVSLEIEKGKFVAIQGHSGCGKSTLLMAAAGMLRPTSGHVKVNGSDIYAMGQAQRADYRARNIGFVFQMFHLVPYLNVIENIMLASIGRSAAARRDRAMDLVSRLGLEDRITHRPGTLSSGEKQRVAIARAMFNEPDIILADEPTGNLDTDNETMVLDHLARINKTGRTVIVVTHGLKAADYADKVIRLEKGRLVD